MGRWSVLLGVLLLGFAVAQLPGKSPMAVTANRFLKSLTPEQRTKAVKAFSDDYRTNWRFVPATRDGINLGELTPEQSELAASLLKASLSDAGMKRVESIKSLEDVLFELENGNKGRDKRLYTFTFFGEPSIEGSWGWRYEGHHVSLNFTYRDGKLISSSPQFFGSNPAEVRSGAKKGFRALPQEDDLGFTFLNSLTESQRMKAILSQTAPGEIVTSNARKASIQNDTGLRFEELDAKQQVYLLKLLRVYSDSQSGVEAKRRWGRVEAKSLVFAWMGGTKPGQGHYYRIQGSKFLIEFDDTQNEANHIHTVWRDFDGDFGQDVLAEHYAEFNHDHR